MFYIDDMVRQHAFGMKHLQLAVALIDEDHVTRLTYNGDKWDQEVPSLVYEIGSVTKTFTAALLAKLLYEGVLRLEDTVDVYLPELRGYPHCPTIFQLATHTSGLTNDLERSTPEAARALEKRMATFSGDHEKDCVYQYITEDDLIDQVRFLQHADHDGFRYSNIGYALLGIVLGKAGGASYQTLITDIIRHDLGLQHTWLDLPKDAHVLPGIGTDNEIKGNWRWGSSGAKAAGAIYATLDDMISYIQRHMDNQPGWLQLTHKRAYAACTPHPFSIGLGWIKEGNLTWHNGATGCFQSFVGFREDRSRGVVLLANCRERNSVAMDTIGKYMLKEDKWI